MISFDKFDRSRQDKVWVDGVSYLIHTEFCYWVAFEKKIKNIQSYDEFDYLYIGGQLGFPKDKEAGLKELIKFYSNEQTLPRDMGDNSSVEVVDWVTDSEYIYTAFLSQYKIDLIKENIHWHDFLSLFKSLKGHVLNDIMAYRVWTQPKKYKSSESLQKAIDDQDRKNMDRWKLEKEKIEPFNMR